MKKGDLFRLHEVLTELRNLIGSDKRVTDIKFRYALEKNLDICEREMKILEKVRVFSEDFQKYDGERIALIRDKYGEKDKENNLVIEKKKGQPDSYKLKDKEGFEKEFEKLKKKYKDIIEENKQKQIDFLKLLEEEADTKFYKVKMEYLPGWLEKEKNIQIKLRIIIPIIEEQ